MFSRRIDYICKYNNLCAEKDMSKKIKTAQKKGEQEELARLEKLQADQAANYTLLTDWLSTAPRLSADNLTLREERKAIEEIASQNNEYGEDNQKSVLAYCHDNDINMSKYFYQQEYAMNLGDGWYAPGNYELELFSKLYVEEMGKKHRIPIMQKFDIDKSLRERLGAVGSWITFNLFFPTTAIRSSTMSKSEWTEDPDNKEKMDIIAGHSINNYFTYTVAEQKITASYMFVFSNDVRGYVVAFKRF